MIGLVTVAGILAVALTPGAIMVHRAGGMFPWLRD